MKCIVTFREYTLSRSKEKENERGEFIGSFDEEIEGKDLMEISENADRKAEQLSQEWRGDVQVFEIPFC